MLPLSKCLFGLIAGIATFWIDEGGRMLLQVDPFQAAVGAGRCGASPRSACFLVDQYMTME